MEIDGMVEIGRPGAVGSRKPDILAGLDAVYGEGGWALAWKVGDRYLSLEEELLLYDEAYEQYFKEREEELDYIAKSFGEVYDNNPSNVGSGIDYSIQEFGGNHFQDIAVRRALVRRGKWFEGEGLLEIRTSGEGARWSPSNIPFYDPALILEPEIPGWWRPGSAESQYQSNKVLLARADPLEPADAYFVTGNKGKVESARRSLPGIDIRQVSMPISEEHHDVVSIAKHKAKVARAVVCRPVLCDDSGFVIPSLEGYPGARVAREIKERGVEHFLSLARSRPLECYWVQALAYMAPDMEKPELFTSKSQGVLIGELRGDLDKPFIKSDLNAAFIPRGARKTLAQMSEEEYLGYKSDRWDRFKDYLASRS